jgi:hypothetical protein
LIAVSVRRWVPYLSLFSEILEEGLKVNVLSLWTYNLETCTALCVCERKRETHREDAKIIWVFVVMLVDRKQRSGKPILKQASNSRRSLGLAKLQRLLRRQPHPHSLTELRFLSFLFFNRTCYFPLPLLLGL